MPPASSKTVLCNGCFDPFHYGHLRHLQAARKLGDVLVVAVTKDRSVKKGVGRPVFTEDQRAAVLRALAIVDEVVLVDNSIEALKLVEPAVFVKGRDYYKKLRREDVKYCEENDIDIVFTNEPTYSSTDLLSYYYALEKSNDRLRHKHEY